VDRVGREIHGADVIIVGKGAPHQNTVQYLYFYSEEIHGFIFLKTRKAANCDSEPYPQY
jgi:hypothetical protein